VHYKDKEYTALNDAKNNCFYQITEIRNRFLALKLMEMGCTRGMLIQKISEAPIHGPIMIKVLPNENLLALRAEDAANIHLSKSEI
jgi:Fe2+ transport system protein FeoA